MNDVKFFIYFSNIAVLVFGVLFIGIGYTKTNYILMILGVALTIYGILRLFRMLKAAKQRDDNTLDN